jgi:ATP-dependent DNA helicase PIF1
MGDTKRARLNCHLDAQQRHVVDLCGQGRNVFFTGMGGTGKTFVLQEIVQLLRRRHGKDKVAVAAPTGVASIVCQGQTLHSLAGCGVPTYVSDFEKCYKYKQRWGAMKVLIIDEVSMLQPSYIDWLDQTIRNLRGRPTEAFGGIQLILCGDFGQLPGICSGVSLQRECPAASDHEIPVNVMECPGFVFQTAFWRDANFAVAELTTVFRQSEVAMVQVLGKIRRGVLDDQVREFMAGCARPLEDQGEIKPTILYARNVDVDARNAANLSVLEGPSVVFNAADSVEADTPAQERLLDRDTFFSNNPLIPKRLELRVGAQVMLTKNIEFGDSVDRLVNGSRGVVKRFVPLEEFASRLKAEDREIVKTLGGQVPEVLFANGRTHICVPEAFEKTVYMTGVCKRAQIPLKLAWALTIHKSQGETLDLVCVDLSGCFAPGQAYVALSRARTREGLSVVGFRDSVVKADPMAIGFHDALTAGALKDFVDKAPMWWAPILQCEKPEWVALFNKAPAFRRWCGVA